LTSTEFNSSHIQDLTRVVDHIKQTLVKQIKENLQSEGKSTLMKSIKENLQNSIVKLG